jgi:3-oxoacyl-[acyl-carrier protein] reductase
MTAASATRMWMTIDELSASLAASITVGRVGIPEDIAAAVSFFVREDPGYVYGQVLYAAGGPLL